MTPRRARTTRFADEEIVAILREADREPAGIVAKRHKVSEQTIYNWRKKVGALSTDEVRRLKQPEAENTRLKKLMVDRVLGKRLERPLSIRERCFCATLRGSLR